ncbi:trigger factor [Undibacterium arcticum]
MRARTAKAPGFRPGKVPLKMVAAQYGYQTESEVLNDKVGRAFSDAANEKQSARGRLSKDRSKGRRRRCRGLAGF